VRNEANFRRTRGRDDPSFHYFILPAFQFSAGGPGAIVQNEPNLEGAAGAGGLACKTKPICRGRPAMGAGRQVGLAGATRPSVRNEANFAIADFGFRTADWGQACGGTARPAACGGQNVQNEPNSAKPAGGPGCQRGKMCETNPICGLDCAKRSQFAGGARRWARGGRSTPPVPPEQNVRNEANLRPDGQAGAPTGFNRAKRTQFAPGQAGRTMAGANRAKRSQFQGRGLGDVGRGGPRSPIALAASGYPGTAPREQSCETKPIRGVPSVKFQV
jgi:hypothetical protein